MRSEVDYIESARLKLQADCEWQRIRGQLKALRTICVEGVTLSRLEGEESVALFHRYIDPIDDCIKKLDMIFTDDIEDEFITEGEIVEEDGLSIGKVKVTNIQDLKKLMKCKTHVLGAKEHINGMVFCKECGVSVGYNLCVKCEAANECREKSDIITSCMDYENNRDKDKLK